MHLKVGVVFHGSDIRNFDLFILRTQIATRGIFWLTYGLILPFQLLTNWWLTSKNIVMYSTSDIIGRRLAGAPIEDLLFGFSMILATLALWEFFSSRIPNELTGGDEEI